MCVNLNVEKECFEDSALVFYWYDWLSFKKTLNAGVSVKIDSFSLSQKLKKKNNFLKEIL